ncbi:DUF6879 family protein [Nocardiopsis synnemataformans]|uniref:DUF6879 family protein n=1 Tax=Nocardiopsis synnemataformans TaxID=61305 RepID=UPI003EB6CB70
MDGTAGSPGAERKNRAVFDALAAADITRLARGKVTETEEVDRIRSRYLPHDRSHSLTDKEFDRLFLECRYTAFRLETLQVYDVGYEREAFAAFLADGELAASDSQLEWNRIISRGPLFHRVHVVTEPLTDYVRFECVCAYRHNVQAGEDVRILPTRKGTWPEGIPQYDYWLFDSQYLVRMHYTTDGTMLAPELITDPHQIVTANVVRDRALHRAVPFSDYDRRFDVRMRPHFFDV